MIMLIQLLNDNANKITNDYANTIIPIIMLTIYGTLVHL